MSTYVVFVYIHHNFYQHNEMENIDINTHNPFTQNTSLIEHKTPATCHNAARHNTGSAVFLKQNFLFVSIRSATLNAW
jgi:hypothetical protein